MPFPEHVKLTHGLDAVHSFLFPSLLAPQSRVPHETLYSVWSAVVSVHHSSHAAQKVIDTPRL